MPVNSIPSASPLDSIPNELLSLIFEHGYFEAEQTDDIFKSYTARVSRRWRNVTLSTPSLWSVLQLSAGNIGQRLISLPIYLERSMDHPLDIRLNCFWTQETNEHLMGLLMPHSKRWRSLSIIAHNTDIFGHIQNTPVPLLRSLKISYFAPERELTMFSLFCGNLPNLTNLCLRNVSFRQMSVPIHTLTTLEIRGYGTWPDYASLSQMLAESTSLTRLVIHVKPGSVLSDVNRRDQPPILLPALRSFEVLTSEWLTHEIRDLVRLFVCPIIETLTIHGYAPSYIDADSSMEIMSFSGGGSNNPRLVVQTSDMYIAWGSLMPSIAATIKTLELRNVKWPSASQFSEMFAAMPALETWLIPQVRPDSILRDMSVDTSSVLPCTLLPSLRTLDIQVQPDPQGSSYNDGVTCLLSMISSPLLSSLALANLTSREWNNVIRSVSKKPQAYPALVSLTLSDIPEPLSCESNPSDAFPYLRDLSLFNVGSNPIIRPLLHQGVWPDLTMLSISGDANASKPLLHRVIAAREEMSVPLRMLFLDKYFTMNLESWTWMKEHVLDVVEIPS